MRADTNKFVHKAENDAQKKRRERKDILKREFRKSAAKSASKFFGKNSPHVDIVEEKNNCTLEIVHGLAELSSPASFDAVLENFLNTVKIDGGELRKGSEIAKIISSCRPAIKEDLTAAVVELLMATEDEKLALDFLKKAKDMAPGRSLGVLEGLIKMSRIEYIHTMTACMEGFVKNPESASDQIERIAEKIGTRTSNIGFENEMLFSDMVLLEVVKENLGLEKD
jgi:hypothetical protein